MGKEKEGLIHHLTVAKSELEAQSKEFDLVKKSINTLQHNIKLRVKRLEHFISHL